MSLRVPGCVVLLCLLCAPGWAGEWDVVLNADSFASWEDEPLLGQGDVLGAQRLRLNVDVAFAQDWRWETAYEVNTRVRRNQVSFQLPIWLRADDLNPVPAQRADQVLLHNLDRLRLTYEKNRWRITLGRQGIGHGNGRFFNPSDIFAPLSPFSLNTEYKSGVDGLRITRGVGELGEAELIALAAREGEGLVMGRIAGHGRGIDYSVMAGRSYGEWTLAYDVAGSAAGAAWYTEGLLRKGEDRDDTVRLSAGVARRFGTKTDVTLETHYHNLTVDGPVGLLFRPEFVHGELFLINRRHVALDVRYEAHPLVSVSASILGETHDGSARTQLGLAWDVGPHTGFSAGYLTTSGGLDTEFGAAGDAVYAELRLTFP